jgi:hypothetical protein
MDCKSVLNLHSEDKVCERKPMVSEAGIVCESNWSRHLEPGGTQIVRFGDGSPTYQYAAEGYLKRWRTRFARRSPVSTTNWMSLPTAEVS